MCAATLVTTHETLELAVTQEQIYEINLFFQCWCKLRKAKNYFDNSWVAIVKNGLCLLGHGTLKSSVSLE